MSENLIHQDFIKTITRETLIVYKKHSSKLFKIKNTFILKKIQKYYSGIYSSPKLDHIFTTMYLLISK